MSDSLPDREKQILTVHATFIHTVVISLLDPARKPELEKHLQTAEQNGWQELCAVIRKIMDGRRDEALFDGLDEEDSTIIKAILRGLQNPQDLPPIEQQMDPAAAAAGLAGLVQQSARGDVQALKILGDMAGQMAAAGGNMALLGAKLKLMLDGERDTDKLTENMDDKGRALVLSILRNINQDTLH